MKVDAGLGAGGGERRRSRTGTRSRDGSRLRAGGACGVEDGGLRRGSCRPGRRRRCAPPVGQRDVQRARVGVGVDRHRLDAHLAARAHDAHGDLSAVGDEDPREHGYIRKMPYRAARTGALQAAEMARASASRVLQRIEDAVVPQPRGGVVGRPFALVLLEDGLADLRLVLGAERAAVARQLVALDRAQHRRPPARRPSPRCARWATSTGSAGRRRGRTCRSCRRRTTRR